MHRLTDPIPVPAHRVADATDFLDGIDPQPTDPYGMTRIWFWLITTFRVLDPATGRPLAGLDPTRFHGVRYEGDVPLGSSRLRLILHNKAAIAIELCLPDADPSVLGRVVPWLQQHLPFQFSAHHWRIWTDEVGLLQGTTDASTRALGRLVEDSSLATARTG